MQAFEKGNDLHQRIILIRILQSKHLGAIEVEVLMRSKLIRKRRERRRMCFLDLSTVRRLHFELVLAEDGPGDEDTKLTSDRIAEWEWYCT